MTAESYTDLQWLDHTRQAFEKLRQEAERALAQVDDAAFFAAAGPESNSLAIIVKHVGGNLRSRWTDLLTTDGEKPDRDRDGEFEIRPGDSRAAIFAAWQQGFAAVDATLAGLVPTDAARTVVIRGESIPLDAAVLRSLTHTAGHVGQIVWLAKHLAGERWQTLTIPRGQSEAWRGGASDPEAGR